MGGLPPHRASRNEVDRKRASAGSDAAAHRHGREDGHEAATQRRGLIEVGAVRQTDAVATGTGTADRGIGETSPGRESRPVVDVADLVWR
jgi:hypothetical protein